MPCELHGTQKCIYVDQNSLAGGFMTPTIHPVLFLTPFPMSYVVASAIKDMLKKLGMMTAGDFPEAASAAMEEMLKKAAHRAKENGRVTVRPCDL